MADYAIHEETLRGQADILRKKFGTEELQDPAEYADKMNLMGMLEEKSASSASVCSFSDGADDVPMSSVIAHIAPTLTGTNAVNMVRCGKNFMPTTNYMSTYFSVASNGVVSQITASASFAWAYSSSLFKTTLPAGTYTAIEELITDVTNASHGVQVFNSSNTRLATISGGIKTAGTYSSTFTLNEETEVGMVCKLYDGTAKIYIVRGSSPTSYEAYTATTYTANLGRTIYGGQADIVNGIGTDENGDDFTFDGQKILSMLGVNNLWHDDGNTEAVYRSSGTVTPVPIQPTLITKTITENDTYYAEDDDADGYSEVTVNVQGGGEEPFVPQFTETLIADNTAHASSFTLTEDYGNYDMVKIVWYESATSSGFLYTTPDILDEIFSVGVGKLCINKPSTNYYACYTKSGLTWTRSNQRIIDVHEVYGVTFTNCTMTATDLYKRGASTTTKYAVTSQTSLKDYDLFMMASIHATDGSETMPTTWLYQYPPENMSEAFSCPVPAVLQEYNANDEAFVISEFEMTAARYFMVQGIKFTTN